MKETQNIWQIAAKVSELFEELSSHDFKAHADFWAPFIALLSKLPGFNELPREVKNKYVTDSFDNLQDELIYMIKDTFLDRIVTSSVTDDDLAYRDAKKDLDMMVVRKVFDRYHGVDVKFEED